MSDSNFKATLYPSPKKLGLSIDALTGGNDTPGNVGIALSGGGSRALTASMGQLRALDYLKTSNGKSLLSQAKALSTVSGGSWFGITFAMQSQYSNETFLNHYVEPQDLTVKGIEELTEGNIGKRITSGFSFIDIGLQMIFYHLFSKTPANMLWQTVIAKHILAPYGLYKAGERQAPTQGFTYNQQSLDEIRNMPGQNPQLNETEFLTLSSNKVPQYFICNTAMFVKGATPQLGDYEYLAPVQCTPFFTGIVGKPGGVDANGRSPGGGGVSSFAFNSKLQSVADSAVAISESRPWSLLDCIGSSSAAFAEKIENLMLDWRNNPAALLEAMSDQGHKNLNQIQAELHTQEYHEAHSWLNGVLNIEANNKSVESLYQDIDRQRLDARSLKSTLTKLSDAIVPRYNYWPVADAVSDPDIKPTKFADAGSLENTGVLSLLSYSDIDSVIAFVNSPTPLSPVTSSNSTVPSIAFDESTKVITTSIIVDRQIPPLFGYQPFENGQYVPYDSGENITKSTAWGVHDQVFPCKDFTDFLTGLWSAAQGSKSAAIYKQTSCVMENTWFGVPARDSFTCVWVYLNQVTDWKMLLKPGVKEKLDIINSFPNYPTYDAELNATEINLLSSMTAWSVGNDDNKSVFIDLFSTKAVGEK